MSRHDGVSCDSCLKSNFHGSRYKCLVCFDYDLCESCYEAGVTNSRHTADHPMQCILTRADFDLFFGGEVLSNPDLPQSYTCPYCARMGYTEITLTDHVNNEHTEPTMEVVCPLCAAMPGGEPNLMTDDFAAHLSLEHRNPSNGVGGGNGAGGGGGGGPTGNGGGSGSDVSRGPNSGGVGSAGGGGGSSNQGPRDLISFMDDPVSLRHNVRRIPHAAQLATRGGQAGRPRRSMLHFSMFDSSGLNSLSPSGREPVDPIAELLCQLSGVRRSTGGGSGSTASTGTGTTNSAHSTPNQLQQLQMQLEHERQHVNAARQQMERLPRRQNHTTLLRECPNVTSATAAASASVTASNSSLNTGGSIMTGGGGGNGSTNHHMHSSSGPVYNLLPINQSGTSAGNASNNGNVGVTSHHHSNNGNSSSAPGIGQAPGQSQHQYLLTDLLDEELAKMFSTANLSEDELHSREMRALFTEELFMSMMYVDADEALVLFDDADEHDCLDDGVAKLAHVYNPRNTDELAVANPINAAESADDVQPKPNLQEALKDVSHSNAPSHSAAMTTRVLRGRARSDGQNALRRADANRAVVTSGTTTPQDQSTSSASAPADVCTPNVATEDTTNLPASSGPSTSSHR